MRTFLWLVLSTSIGGGLGYYFWDKLILGFIIGFVVGVILRFLIRFIGDILDGLDSVFD